MAETASHPQKTIGICLFFIVLECSWALHVPASLCPPNGVWVEALYAAVRLGLKTVGKTLPLSPSHWTQQWPNINHTADNDALGDGRAMTWNMVPE